MTNKFILELSEVGIKDIETFVDINASIAGKIKNLYPLRIYIPLKNNL